MEQHELISYLQGQLSEAERQAIEAWLKADPANQTQLDRLKSLTAMIQENDAIQAPDINIAWQKVQKRIESPARRRWNPLYLWAGVAASLLVLVLAYLTQPAGNQTEWLVINGQADLTRHLLPDSTAVWLKANSRLQYPEAFGDTERRVKLVGEGFFEVHREEDRPFMIESGQMLTEVLGTSFNLMAFPDSQKSWVQVRTGKVAFYHTNKQEERLILEAGQKGVYDKGMKTFVKNESADANRFAWKTGELTFRDTPLQEVVDLLSDLYQKEIKLCSADLGERKFNAQFKQESLDSVLESICIIFELQQTNPSNNEIILNSIACLN